MTSGTVLAIGLCPGYRKPVRAVGEADAVANLGLRGDVHALPDSIRQLLLIDQETLALLGLTPGQVKENITTRGLDVKALGPGDRLAIGESVVLEITKECHPCSRMEEIRAGLREELAGRRGMLARVVEGGTLRRGDAIRLLPARR